MADILDPAVGDAGDAEARRELGDAVDGGGLRAADGHDLLRDAGAAGAHADAQAVDAGGDEGGRLVPGHDVAADDVEVGVGLFDPLDHGELVLGVALAGVEDDDVEARVDEGGEAGFVGFAGSDGGGGEELFRAGDFGGEGEVEVFH